MSTIDNINTNIITKITELQKIANIVNTYELEEKDALLIQSFINELDEILAQYEFGTIDVLKEYYQCTEDMKKIDLYNKYIKYISSENIVGKIKRIYAYCQKLIRVYDLHESDLDDAIQTYDSTYLNIEINDKAFTNVYCKCNAPYNIDAKTSESVCKKCGNSEKLYGIVFEDEQFFYQEGQRTKHGKYDPIKHCRFWIDRIEAKESVDNIDYVVNKVKMCVKRDRIWLESLTCEMIRAYLKELRETDYNNHVALIKKKITNKEPAYLTDHERKKMYFYFSIAVQNYSRTKPDYKSSCPYHPYFIYKIAEQILNTSEDRIRKEEILSTIHLQSRETLIENDRIWEPICAEIPEFKYCPTNSS